MVGGSWSTLAISWGVRKMPLPMTLPTMIATPPQNPIARFRSAAGGITDLHHKGTKDTKKVFRFVVSVSLWWLFLRDALDLDGDAAGERAGLDRGARREGRLEVGRVDLVHRREVVDVLQIDVALDDLVERRARRLEDRLDVLERLAGFLPNVAHLLLAGRGIG